METRRAKLVVNKGGQGGTTFRATVPTKWIRNLGLNEETRDIRLIFDSDRIIIENAAKPIDLNIVYKTMYKLADELTEVTDEQINEIVETTLDKFEEDYLSFENFDENTLRVKLNEYIKKWLKMLGDLVGKTINELTVIEEYKKGQYIYCKCECSCGNIADVIKKNLKQNNL